MLFSETTSEGSEAGTACANPHTEGVRRTAGTSLHAALDAIPAPLLLVAGDRRVVAANRSARPAATACLALFYGRVCGFNGTASAQFGAVFSAAQGGAQMAVAVATGRGKHAGFWRVWFSPVERALVMDASADAFVLVGVEPPPAPTAGVAIVKRLFALTGADARVLELLLGDHSPRQIAGQLGISIATVRSHLAALFAKTDTRRQSELVRLAISAASR